MKPIACLFAENAAARHLSAPLAGIFSPVLAISPLLDMPHDAGIQPLSPPMPPEDAAKLLAFAGALKSGEAAQHDARLKAMLKELLDFSANSADDDERGSAVLSAVRSGDKARDSLMRERILLLLASQVERDEAELAAGLAKISAQEQAVYAAVNEEGEEHAGASGIAAQLPENREPLKAWSRLLANVALPCARPCFVTANAGLFQALLERAHRAGTQAGTQRAEPFLTLPLKEAGISGDNAQIAEQLARIQDAANADAARAILQNLASQGAGLLPEGQAGRARTLALHLLPGCEFSELLSATLADDGGEYVVQNGAAFCLVGLARA